MACDNRLDGWERQTCLSVGSAGHDSTHKQACMCHPGPSAEGCTGNKGRRYMKSEDDPKARMK